MSWLRLVGLLVLVLWHSAAVAEPAVVGDAARGKRVFWTCRTCHYPEQSVGHNNGPSLWNIFNLKIGRQPGFAYSEAMRQIDAQWTPALMDVWLQNPALFLPGNRMMSPGIDSAQDRADLIAYLQGFSPRR